MQNFCLNFLKCKKGYEIEVQQYYLLVWLLGVQGSCCWGVNKNARQELCHWPRYSLPWQCIFFLISQWGQKVQPLRCLTRTWPTQVHSIPSTMYGPPSPARSKPWAPLVRPQNKTKIITGEGGEAEWQCSGKGICLAQGQPGFNPQHHTWFLCPPHPRSGPGGKKMCSLGLETV